MLQREYKTFEKNPTQWEIDISRIHVDLEEAKKVYNKWDKFNQEKLKNYLDQNPMGYGLYLKSDKGFIQDGFYKTENEAIYYQEERAEEMPDIKTFIFKTHDNEN
jgi:hypothetical protein